MAPRTSIFLKFDPTLRIFVTPRKMISFHFVVKMKKVNYELEKVQILLSVQCWFVSIEIKCSVAHKMYRPDPCAINKIRLGSYFYFTTHWKKLAFTFRDLLLLLWRIKTSALPLPRQFHATV